MKPHLKFASLALLAIFPFLTGCSDMRKAKSLADPQIDVFHKLLNEEKYAEIYSTSDPLFQKSSPEPKVTEFLSAVHRKLGKVTSTSNTTWNVNTYNATTRIVLIQSTVFEQGSGTETFTFLISDPDAKLLGYNISSSELITK